MLKLKYLFPRHVTPKSIISSYFKTYNALHPPHFMIGKKSAALDTVNLTAEIHNCNYLRGPRQWMQHLKTAGFKDVSFMST